MGKDLINPAFDYSLIDGEAKGKLIWFAGEIRKQQVTHVESGLAMGRMLVDARELCGEKPFRDWVLAECGFAIRTAYNYITAFEEFGECATVAHIELSAMYELAKNEKAKKAALKLAAKGVPVTQKVAKELVEKHKPKQATGSDKGKPGGADPPASLDTSPPQECPANSSAAADSDTDDPQTLDAGESGGQDGQQVRGQGSPQAARNGKASQGEAGTVQCPTCKGKGRIPKADQHEGFRAFWELATGATLPKGSNLCQSPAAAKKEYRLATKRLAGEEYADPEGFLRERFRLFVASPAAQSKYCPKAATWLRDERYHEDEEQWQGNGAANFNEGM